MPPMGSMPPGMQGQPMPGQPHGAYGGMGPGPGQALEPPLPAEGRRRSSIMRDIAIGVAIAGVVLGGFLAVKHFVLDAEEEPASASLAKLLVSMPGIERADLFIDSQRHASVGHNIEVQVPAGKHEVKLVAGDQQCTQEITLVADQVTPIECNMKPEAGSGAGAGVGSAGSAAAGSAEAGSAGSGSAGSGSGTQVAAADPPPKPEDKTDTAAEKAAEKAAAEKAAAEKAAEKAAAAEKAKAEKAAAAEKARLAAEKAKRDKLPLEDNPADRAASVPQKGWVVLTSKPSAKIIVDGNDTGMSTPITGRSLALAPGRHRITFQIGGDKYTFTVIVKAGETVTLDKMLQ